MVHRCDVVPARAVPDSWETIRAFLVSHEGEHDTQTNDPSKGFSVLQALTDMPDFGVTKGDLGGVIENGATIAYQDPCWISPESLVDRYSYLGKNTFVGKGVTVTNSRLLHGVRIDGPGFIHDSFLRGEHHFNHAFTSIVDSTICGNLVGHPDERGMLAIRHSFILLDGAKTPFIGSCRVIRSHLTGSPSLDHSLVSYALLSDNARLVNAHIDRSTIRERAHIEGSVQDSIIEGRAHITSTGKVSNGALVKGSVRIDGVVNGGDLVGNTRVLAGTVLDSDAVTLDDQTRLSDLPYPETRGPDSGLGPT